jgi:hypothetical protein
MRKRIMTPDRPNPDARGDWLDVEGLAQVELTSEDPAYPIEAAFKLEDESAWRAAGPGAQVIRLLFDAALKLRRIRLVFDEAEDARTQEFVLRWSPDGGRSYRDIVRQQYTFSPPSTSREIEDFHVDIEGVTALELTIIPDISGSNARASLTRFLLG